MQNDNTRNYLANISLAHNIQALSVMKADIDKYNYNNLLRVSLA